MPSGGGPATNEDLNNPNSVYSRAHSLATPQSPVIRVLFDKNGKVTQAPQKAVRLEYRMNEFDKKSIIQIAK